MQAAFLLL